MIVEQVEAFKSWLTAVLKPMCEADPGALAKYVLALVKKDKSEDELRKLMVGQLDVFLETETPSFVNLVLQTLATKEYINTPVIPNANPPNPNVLKATKDEQLLQQQRKENKVIVSPSELPSLSDAINGSGAVAAVGVGAKKEAVEVPAKRDSREVKKPGEVWLTEEPHEKPPPVPVRRRSRHRSLSRNRSPRSRSRSWDRTKRSRSREKSQHRIEREKRDRPRIWRNKSPPRRYDRRRSRTPSPMRKRSRSRSPRHAHRGGRYRSRSRSRSRDRKEPIKEVKEAQQQPIVGGVSRPGTPTQDSNHGDMDLRLTNSTQSIQSVVVQQVNKRRCRDFDEKGYCMRGEMCPFDHGVDPVVLEDTVLPRVLGYNPNGGDGGAGAGLVVNGPPAHHVMGPRGMQVEYNPQAPQMWNRSGYRGPRPMNQARMPSLAAFPPQPNMQRELIPVPVLDNKPPSDSYNQNFNNPQNNYNNMDNENMFIKKRNFDYARLGPRKNTTNCSLELKKVPTGLNSITHLNNHFSKFGKIVNIQVQYEGDPEASIVTFSSHAEANAAYRSTEAVLNNRFIKVFWHNCTNNNNTDGAAKQENIPPRSVKDRLGVPGNVAPNTNKVLNLVNNENQENVGEAQVKVQKEESKQATVAAIKKNQELLAAKEKLKKNQDEQRKEVMKIKSDLQKRKQELLEKQLSQQKILIEKMEKLPAGPQRDLIKDTIKKTQETIEEIKKDLEQTQTTLSVKIATPAKKSKEDTKREMLDAELDLITKQQEGADTSELQKKLFELRAKISGRGGGGGGVRGRGGVRRFNPMLSRHLLSKNNLIDASTRAKVNLKVVNQGSFQKHTVDHRPTRILVSGYETDEQESVLSHFQQYGEVAEYTIDSALPSIVLTYKTRKEAEMALLKGKHFQDRTLSITWCNNLQPSQRSGRSSTRTVLMSESEEDQLMDQGLLEGDDELGPEISEEVLLQDDEEEEEENDDRSWRR